MLVLLFLLPTLASSQASGYESASQLTSHSRKLLAYCLHGSGRICNNGNPFNQGYQSLAGCQSACDGAAGCQGIMFGVTPSRCNAITNQCSCWTVTACATTSYNQNFDTYLQCAGSPTQAPTTGSPTTSRAPTVQPTLRPTQEPSYSPSQVPTQAPSMLPTVSPSPAPTQTPTEPSPAAIMMTSILRGIRASYFLSHIREMFIKAVKTTSSRPLASIDIVNTTEQSSSSSNQNNWSNRRLLSDSIEVAVTSVVTPEIQNDAPQVASDLNSTTLQQNLINEINQNRNGGTRLSAQSTLLFVKNTVQLTPEIFTNPASFWDTPRALMGLAGLIMFMSLACLFMFLMRWMILKCCACSKKRQKHRHRRRSSRKSDGAVDSSVFANYGQLPTASPGTRTPISPVAVPILSSANLARHNDNLNPPKSLDIDRKKKDDRKRNRREDDYRDGRAEIVTGPVVIRPFDIESPREFRQDTDQTVDYSPDSRRSSIGPLPQMKKPPGPTPQNTPQEAKRSQKRSQRTEARQDDGQRRRRQAGVGRSLGQGKGKPYTRPTPNDGFGTEPPARKPPARNGGNKGGRSTVAVLSLNDGIVLSRQ